MAIDLYPSVTPELTALRRQLAPEAAAAFHAFGEAVFAEGALSARTKQIIAVAVAHVTQCPYCIRGHTRAALREGASSLEIVEAIWVAAEMRAGAAFAHSVISLEQMNGQQPGAVNGDDHRHNREEVFHEH